MAMSRIWFAEIVTRSIEFGDCQTTDKEETEYQAQKKKRSRLP